MKKLFTRPVYFLLLIVTCVFSCNKPTDIRPPSDGEEGTTPNKIPKADAGADQIITFPNNSTVLDGRASVDSDGYISIYKWTNISVNDCIIQSPISAVTTIHNLIVGVYHFVLGIRDNKGAVSSDTVQVTVKYADGECDVQDRPQLNATLTEIGTLSSAGTPQVAVAGSKIFFVSSYYNYVGFDIYDINTHAWQTVSASLSQPRTNMSIVACGNKIFFAGGNNSDTWYDIVDIYDISTGNWTIAHLSEAKVGSATATIDDKVFFAGGATDDGWNQTNRVDIYDISDDSWSIAELSEGKLGPATITAGNKLYFAAGWNYLSGINNPMTPLKSVDIYDASTNTWSGTNLNFLSGGVSGVAEGDKIYWGGISWSQYEGNVEVWNTANGGITKYCLSYPRSYPAGLVKNNEIAFFVPSRPEETISDRFDIYDPTTDKWSIGVLDHAIALPAVITVNNVVYIAGGKTSNGYTSKVYILNW